MTNEACTPMQFRNQHASNMQERSNRVRAKLPSGYVMTPEQERSMHHMELGTICKCGHKETKVKSVHLTALI